MIDVSYIDSGDNRCAFVHSPGTAPGVFFLGGFNSSMQGLKALALEQHCRSRGIEFTRFDYSGHGQSSGLFTDGCIGEWLGDALAVFDRVTDSNQIIVGSSIGAWIGALLAMHRSDRIVAIMGLASALDFTRDLADRHFNDAQRAEIQSKGVTYIPSCYDNEAPYPITRRLIDDGNRHCLLNAEIDINSPVHLLHGTNDQDINWLTSVQFAQRLSSKRTILTLIKGGDHRLSSDRHLEIIIQALDELRDLTTGTR